MKKRFWFVLTLLLSCFMFMSFSPSLDGRAVVADEGVLPQGIFAKTVGYLPGDSISVTNLVDKTTVDILVIGALDPSEGVAILLTPEAAKLLGISKNSNNVVKITKRTGQLDEAVAGSALISKNQENSEEKTEEPLIEPEENLPEPEEKTSEEEIEKPVEEVIQTEENVIPQEEKTPEEEKPLSKPLESSEVVETPVAEEVSKAEETTILEEIPQEKTESELPQEKVTDVIEEAEPVENVEQIPEEKTVEIVSEKVESENITEPADETEKVDETIPENAENLEKVAENLPSENVDLKSEETEENINEEIVKSEIAENVENPVEAEIIKEEIDKAKSTGETEKITDEMDYSNSHIDVVKSEKVETDIPLPPDEIKSEKITKDGELFVENPEKTNTNEEEISETGEPVLEKEKVAKVEEPVESEKITSELEDKDYLSGPEKNVSTVPFKEEELPKDYDKHLEELQKNKEKEEIYVAEEIVKEPVNTDELPPESAFNSVVDVETPSETEKTSENAETYDAIVLVPAENNPPVEEKTSEETKTETDEAKNSENTDSILPEETVIKNEIVSVNNELKVEEKTESAEIKIIPEVKDYDYSKYTVENLKSLESGKYYIQIAVLSDKNNIKSIFDKYIEKYPIVLVPLKSGKAHQVMVGPLNVDEYGTVIQRFKSYGFKDCFLRKIK